MNFIAAALAAGVLQLPLPPILPPVIPLPPLPPPPDVCNLPPPLPAICLPPVAPPGDDPPKMHGVLTATRDGRYVTLKWRPATDDIALAGYRVYRDGLYRKRLGPLATHTRAGFPCGRHRWRVEAVDSSDQTASAAASLRRPC